MKFITEYRDRKLVSKLVETIKHEAHGNYVFMEVCGSHTHAIRRHGIPSLLPESIRLLSGPGCPVCVTDQSFIDKAVWLSEQAGVVLTTFGDLIRVPGTRKSLSQCHAQGADVRVVYSPLEALEMAKAEPQKEIVFAAIGFETTAPSTAVTLQRAREEALKNFSVLCAHKLMPPAMHAVIEDGIPVNGYICPGHVSSITGSRIYQVFARRYKVATVVAGFEPTDILQSVLMLLRQVNHRSFRTEIQYKRAVSSNGNVVARDIMNDVFVKSDTRWRGFGILPKSGLRLNKRYEFMDAEKRFNINIPEVKYEKSCICGDILKGRKEPGDCRLFGRTCTPDNPVGACMVSAEGSCNAHFKYRNYA